MMLIAILYVATLTKAGCLPVAMATGGWVSLTQLLTHISWSGTLVCVASLIPLAKTKAVLASIGWTVGEGRGRGKEGEAREGRGGEGEVGWRRVRQGRGGG